jgi:ubiquinone/menaquinone biosynthesis C-methylase UbiE
MFYKTNIGTNNEKNWLDWIKEALSKLPKGSRILDAGAGQLKYKKYCSHLNYVSQDFCKYKGKGNKKGLQPDKWDTSSIDIESDIINIPEKDRSFDAILCTEVLEHIPEPVKALKEFSRLLKPNGYLILTAPFCSGTHFAPFHYCSGFNQYFYNHHLTNEGFEIIELSPNGNYYSYLAQEIRRINYCSKKYSLKKIGLFGRIVIRLILSLLDKYEKKDSDSSDFLCFGYHILARKT